MSRPSTPADVARQLRREAGFGCCNCGVPILQYHHTVPYHVDQHFRAEDMMVLCPTCHHQATVGALNEQQQRRLKEAPYNLRRGQADGLLYANPGSGYLQIGNLFLAGSGPVLAIHEFVVLSVDLDTDHQVLLTCRVADEAGNLLIEIVDNEWIVGDINIWDIEAAFNSITIRRKARDVILAVDLRSDPVEIRGKFHHENTTITLKPGGAFEIVTPYQNAILDRVLVPGNLIEVGLDEQFHMRSHAGGYSFMNPGQQRPFIARARLERFHKFLDHASVGPSGFEDALRAAPESDEWRALVLINLAVLLRDRGDLQQARELLQDATETDAATDEDRARAYCLLADVFEKLDDELAATHMRAEGELLGNYLWSPRCVFDSAKARLQRGDTQGALQTFFELFHSVNATVNIDSRVEVMRMLEAGIATINHEGRVVPT